MFPTIFCQKKMEAHIRPKCTVTQCQLKVEVKTGIRVHKSVNLFKIKDKSKVECLNQIFLPFQGKCLHWQCCISVLLYQCIIVSVYCCISVVCISCCQVCWLSVKFQSRSGGASTNLYKSSLRAICTTWTQFCTGLHSFGCRFELLVLLLVQNYLFALKFELKQSKFIAFSDSLNLLLHSTLYNFDPSLHLGWFNNICFGKVNCDLWSL